MQWAEMEAEMIAKEDAYFKSRSPLDHEDNRQIWRAGFERGYRTERLSEGAKRIEPLQMGKKTTSG